MGRVRRRHKRKRRRRGGEVTDSYSMHNNRVRLSTCIAPSISPWRSHLRPMETHTQTHTHLYKDTEGWLQAATQADYQSWRKKKITPWCFKFQLIWGRSHWQARLQWTKPLPISGTFPKKHIVLTCMPTHRAPYVCNVHTLSFSPTHTPWPLWGNSQTQKYWLEGLLEGSGMGYIYIQYVQYIAYICTHTVATLLYTVRLYSPMQCKCSSIFFQLYVFYWGEVLLIFCPSHLHTRGGQNIRNSSQ